MTIPGLLAASAGATGSIFSGLGFGVMEDVNSSRAAGMGNAGLALDDSNTVSFANPALLSSILRTRIAIGGYFSRQWMSDPTGSDKDDWAQFEFFGLGLPIKKNWGLGFMLAPYSRVEFKYAWNGSLNGFPYLETVQGTGGLTRASMNLAWAPLATLRLGVAGNLIWGDVSEYRTSVFDAPGYLDVQFATTKQYMGFGGTAGVLFKPTSRLALAATVEPQIPLHEDRTFSYTAASDSVVNSKHDYTLAGRYGLGASFQLTPKWLISAQGIYGAWGGLKDLPEDSAGYRNSLDLGVGAEWSPGAWNSEGVLKQLQYRFGLRRESTYLISNGHGVDAYVASAGISYPFHQGLDRLDLGFEYGSRGNLSNNGGRENTFRVRLGLNLGESWFQRTKPPWES